MTDTNSAPIACTLSPPEYKARLGATADLNRDALLCQTRHDLELRLVYTADATERVREMVRQEQDCCAFLIFDLDERLDEIRLTITVPERARSAADMLFAQFLPPSAEAADCICC